MKIAFLNIFGETKNAEQETLMRLQYVFTKLGHTMLILDANGYVISDHLEKGLHVEDANVDFIFTYNGVEQSLMVLPDVFSVFLHWTPFGFFENAKALLYMKLFHSFDFISYSNEKEIAEKWLQIATEDTSFFGPSVPVDYVIAPRRQEKRELFYVGINFERALAHMRYSELFSELDAHNCLKIYGPQKVYGRKNLWTGFHSYQGEIPFDGKSIIQKINEAGICLAINSPMHNDANAVTNRTYEAAAAGAVMISDDNEFVRRYFGDSVFYLDLDASEKETAEKIIDIIIWVNEHPEEAYAMACRSQCVFLKYLTLDKMVEEFLKKILIAIDNVHDKTRQTDIIDVICFVDAKDEYPIIFAQLKKQYYQNLHYIIVCQEEVYTELDKTYPFDLVLGNRNERGKAFVSAIELFQGSYFMFVDCESVLHSRHIYKNYEVLSKNHELFAYSGCYLKHTTGDRKKYTIMNDKPILQSEFLLFRCISNGNTDWYYRDCQTFYIETLFSRSAGLFRTEILKYADNNEIVLISDNIHLYLACCSLIKAHQLGRFTYALTTGYWGDSISTMERRVFGYPRRHWYSNRRSAKTFIKEFNEIFFQYNFEVDLSVIQSRNSNGEMTRYGGLPIANEGIADIFSQKDNILGQERIIRFIKKVIPKPIKKLIRKCIDA